MTSLHPLFPSPSSALFACVIVPCKNEAERLQAALGALARQVDRNGRPIGSDGWEVLLLVNNSTDRSFDLAARFGCEHPHLPLRVAECSFPAEQANIGHIRKLLMDTACERFSGKSTPLSLILSTDADTEVAPDWLAQNLEETRRGAEAIGGRILLSSRDRGMADAQTKRIQSWDDRYNLLVSWLEHVYDPQSHDPWPRHHQHFAACLAVRPEVYKKVGGLPPKESLEDVAFYEALVRRDFRFRHSPDVVVHTSGRLEGRASHGLADQMYRWSQGPSKIVVPSARLWETFFALRQRLRAVWKQTQMGTGCSCSVLQDVAAKCGSEPDELKEALDCKWFGSAFESLNLMSKLQKGLLRGRPMEPLEEAVAKLESRSQLARRPASSSLEEVQSCIAAF